MGDFLGFEFGGVHSSELGITRVSGGDRYDEDLHPEIKDRTAEVPGLNGEYYFGSDFGTRVFELEIAFDHLTEEQFRRIRRVFGTKDIKKLVFDERPYKYYMVKLESPIQLSYVCFDEPGYTWEKVQTAVDTYIPGIKSEYYEHKVYNNTIQRIYKGEGKISLVAHFPFAKSNFKTLSDEQEREGWASSSGILSASNYESIDTYNSENHLITVYNPGDMETGFRLYLPRTAIQSAVQLNYKFPSNSPLAKAVLSLEPVVLKGNEAGVLIDTNSGLILGVPTTPVEDQQGGYIYSTNGRVYNQHVESGYFFKIDPTIGQNATIEIAGDRDATGTLIFYDYLYF